MEKMQTNMKMMQEKNNKIDIEKIGLKEKLFKIQEESKLK
jgi:hypothetical protein